jgi:hypothetical protein
MRLVNHYLVEGRVVDVDPLLFWKARDSEASDFSTKAFVDVAREFLTPTPSTVEVERLFSSAADVITPDRNRLNPMNSKMILFLKENLPLVNFTY